MSISAARRPVEDAIVTYQNLIGGKWQPASDARTVDVVSPSDGIVFARLARGTAADIDAAVKAARRAFEEGAWSKLTAVERGRLMLKLGQKILDHLDELAELEARDTGKPMKQARADITATAQILEFYGAAADKVHGEVMPFLDGHMSRCCASHSASPRTSFPGTTRRRCSGAPWRPRSRWATPP